MTKTEKKRGFSVPTVTVLGVLMAACAYFFIVQIAQDSLRPAAWIVAGYFLALFILLEATGNIALYRRIFFVSCALLFFPSFMAGLVEARGSISLDAREVFLNRTPFCHIVIPLSIVPYLLKGVLVFPARLSNHYASAYSMIAIWLFATLTIGRGWCSWACFYGGWDDGMSRFSGKARLEVRDPEKRLRHFGFAVLAFSVLAGVATMTSVYCAWLCPFKTVTEFGSVTGPSSYLAFIIFILLFFSLAIVLPALTKKRVQCMSFCPFGAFQSVAGKVSPYRVGIDPETCVRCGLCARACPTMSIDEAALAAGKPAVLSTCTRCGECVTVCPKRAARYFFVWKKGCGQDGGRMAGLRERLGQGGRAGRFIAALLLAAEELLSPRALLTTTGFTIGMIVAGSFATGTVARIMHLLATGSFLLGGAP
jgi:ferredoxin-type protein NapH